MSRQSRYLHPGQILVAKQPTAVTTILGSCVSVCLFDSTRQIGGINHFMLPNWVGRGRASSRFGNIAVANLVEGMVFEGSTVRDLRAKLFGGSHLFSSGDAADTESLLGGALGLRNVDVAREELGSLGIQVIAEDIGGTHGRKLIFYTDDGSIKIKQLRRSDQGQDA
jgi:chemotaxis protein CheD